MLRNRGQKEVVEVERGRGKNRIIDDKMFEDRSQDF